MEKEESKESAITEGALQLEAVESEYTIDEEATKAGSQNDPATIIDVTESLGELAFRSIILEESGTQEPKLPLYIKFKSLKFKPRF